MRISAYLGVMLAATLLAAVAPADDAPAWRAPGPEVGQRFLDMPKLPDSTGRQRSLDELMGPGGVTIVFVRSADWCPYCQRQLRELNERADAFAAAGYPLVSVSVDDVPAVAAFATVLPARFVMLADRDSAATDALGIRDPRYPVGSARAGVPQPGIFVVDKMGRVVAKYFVEGYRDRPDPDVVLAAVRSLTSSTGSGVR